MVELWGPDAEAIRAVVAAACQRLGWPAYRLELHGLPRELGEHELARLVSREARLAPAAFMLDTSRVEPGAVARLRRKAPRSRESIIESIRQKARARNRPEPRIDPDRPVVGEFRVEDVMNTIRQELARHENVIIDTRHMNTADIQTLRDAFAGAHLDSRVKFFPPVP